MKGANSGSVIRSGSILDRASKYFFIIISLIFAGGVAALLVIVGSPSQVLANPSFRLYAVLGIAGSLASLAVLFLKAETRVGLGMTAVLCLAGIGVTELYLSRDDVLNSSVALARAENKSFDVRSIGQVVADARKAGESLSITIHPEEFIPTPLLVDGQPTVPMGSLINARVVVCNEPGTFIFFETDEQGFNNPPGLWNHPTPILVIGDSYAEGWCVKREASFVGKIRERYPSTINLARGGLGSLTELAVLREYVPILKPKIVLWFFFENDEEGLAREMRSSVLRRYLEEPSFRQGLAERIDRVDVAVRSRSEEILSRQLGRSSWPFKGWRTFINEKLPGYFYQAQKSHQSASPEFVENFRRVMVAANDAAASQGARLLFVYLGSYKGSTNKNFEAQMTKLRATTLGIVRDLGIPALDTVPKMLAIEPNNPQRFHVFGRTGHYNEEGHALVGAMVLQWLAEQENR